MRCVGSDTCQSAPAVLAGCRDAATEVCVRLKAVSYQIPLQVRRRKGLAVDKKVVQSATKQRTRARKV